MTQLRSARLRGLLGAELDDLTVEHVKALVESGVAEAFDLDFKRDLYGPSDSEKRSLALDVAALANEAGGVLLLGIDDDDQARACAAPGVDTSDAQLRRITQIVAGSVVPLPSFDVFPVCGQDGAEGFIIIAVAQSALAPHAVLVNESLRYPRRTGTTTRYLSEPEVAAAYRDRWVSASERLRHADGIEADAAERLDPASPWLVVSCVPEVAGRFEISSATYRAFESEVRDKAIHPLAGGGPQFHRVDVGFERLTASGSLRENEPTEWGILADVYTDGSGVVATQLWNIRQGVRPSDSTHTLSEEGLAGTIAGSLRFLSRHAAIRAQTSSVALFRALVVPSPAVEKTHLGHARRGFPIPSGRPITKTTPVASTYALIDDVASRGTDLLVTANQLHLAIGHAFGQPELLQLTNDGQLRWPYWGNDYRPAATSWATANGVEHNNEVVNP